MAPIGNLSPQGSIALGVFAGLLSTSVQSIGLTLQRKSHLLEDEKGPDDYRRPPFKRRRWQLGMLMFIVANLAGSSIQITTLPLPVLSTLQASGLVFNSICAALILGEPFTRWSLGGTILVFGGAVLIAGFGAIGEPAHDLDQLLALMGRREFIAWMTCTLVLALAIVAAAKCSKHLRPWAKNHPKMRLFRGISYGGVSGILSAHSLLLAKSAVELLVRTIVDEHNQFNRWQSWIILLGLLALALSQLYYLHRGLKLCSTSILYPFVFCVYNIIAIIDGLIYFNQTNLLSALHACLVALGTFILLNGVLALSWRLNIDTSHHPSVAPQTPLTPGLGMIDENSPETVSTIASPVDEETPLIDKESPYSGPIPRTPTPTSRSDLAPNLPRTLRRAESEHQEIWNDLQHDTLPLMSPFSARGVSIRSASNASRNRNSHFNLPKTTEENAVEPTESTRLRARSGTGRSYRDYRRRRSTLGSETKRRGRSISSQEALGGWWERLWWKRRSRGKDKGKENRESGSGSGGQNRRSP